MTGFSPIEPLTTGLRRRVTDVGEGGELIGNGKFTGQAGSHQFNSAVLYFGTSVGVVVGRKPYRTGDPQDQFSSALFWNLCRSCRWNGSLTGQAIPKINSAAFPALYNQFKL
jgi:hypothetical protein